MNTIYSREFSNKIQKKVINDTLDKLLKNNDVLLKNNIYSFLSGKCDRCSEEIVNPRLINTIHVCEKCINKYIYCTEEGCCVVSFHKDCKKRCKRCLSWYCRNHNPDKCYCREQSSQITKFFRKLRKRSKN